MRPVPALLLLLAVGCGRCEFEEAGVADGSLADRSLDAPGDAVVSDRPGDREATNPPDLTPAYTLFTSGAGTAIVNGVAMTASGPVVIGAFRNEITFNDEVTLALGSLDAFIAGFDDAGGLRFAETYGGTSLTDFRAVDITDGTALLVGGILSGQTDFGGVVLDGGNRQDVLLLSFDPSGELLERGRYPGDGANAQGRGIAAAPSLVAVTGTYGSRLAFNGIALPSAASDDGFLAILSGFPNPPLSARAFPSGGNAFGNDVAIHGEQLCSVGRFDTNIDLGTPQGSINSGGSGDGYVLGTRTSGGGLWGITQGSDRGDTFLATVALPNGDCIVAGLVGGAVTTGPEELPYGGMTDGYLGRFSATGAVWEMTFGGPGIDNLRTVARLGELILVGGSFTGTIEVGSVPVASAGGRDGLVVALNPGGEVQWVYRFGGAGDETVEGVALKAGEVVVTGSYVGATTIGTESTTSPNDQMYVHGFRY
ncbi:MAG: hypothetical protein AAGF12_29780 [Myxococcota bacterium]